MREPLGVVGQIIPFISRDSWPDGSSLPHRPQGTAQLEMATDLEADHVVNALTTNPLSAIQALGGDDVAVALPFSPASFDQADTVAAPRRSARARSHFLPTMRR